MTRRTNTRCDRRYDIIVVGGRCAGAATAMLLARPGFALLGVSQGGAVAVDYAARHPDRVSHLILYGSFAAGRFVRAQRA
jgi:pimeloyl-ACP methyl ester carboxylesterase